MTRVSPQQGAEKWKQNLGAATQNILTGIQNTQKDPPRLALAAAPKWQQNVSQSRPKFEAGLQRTSQADWKKATADAVSRVADGANRKVGKMADFNQQFYPHLDQGIAQLANMPSMTFEDNVQRAVFMMRHNRNFKRS